MAYLFSNFEGFYRKGKHHRKGNAVISVPTESGNLKVAFSSHIDWVEQALGRPRLGTHD